MRLRWWVPVAGGAPVVGGSERETERIRERESEIGSRKIKLGEKG